MRILLDTHLLLWSLARPSNLSAPVCRKIDAAEVYASAASIWEISIKSTLGKLDANPREVLDGIEPAGFSLLAVSGEHAARASQALGAQPGLRLALSIGRTLQQSTYRVAPGCSNISSRPGCRAAVPPKIVAMGTFPVRARAILKIAKLE
jgi:PIN domain nuclease of toxin-antitoxin system